MFSLEQLTEALGPADAQEQILVWPCGCRAIPLEHTGRYRLTPCDDDDGRLVGES